jgi:kinesin family member 16B
MESKLIVEMDGKKTRLMKPSKLTSMRELIGRDAYNDFTFDYSYWSFDDADEKYTPQDEVFQDLGTDVVECAFQGMTFSIFNCAFQSV